MQKALSFLLAFLFLIFTENALGGGDFFCSGCAGVTSSSNWVTIYSQGTGVHLFGQYVKASGLNKTGFYLKDLQDTRETIQQMTSIFYPRVNFSRCHPVCSQEYYNSS